VFPKKCKSWVLLKMYMNMIKLNKIFFFYVTYLLFTNIELLKKRRNQPTWS